MVHGAWQWRLPERLRLSRRLAAVVASVVILVVATALAVVAASTARTPGQRAALALPPDPSLVTVNITTGQVVDELRLDGRLTRTSAVEVTGPAAVEGASRLVVTHTPVKAGDRVGAGRAVVEVSGRPVLVLAGSFPAYRPLTSGDSGRDVEQLQRALRPRYGTPVTGIFNARTENDIRRLYASAGYEPVTELVESGSSGTATPAPVPERHVVVPVGEIAYVPTLPATVGEVRVRVGQDATGPLLTLISGSWHVVATVDENTEQALKPQASIRFGAGPLAGQPSRLIEIRDTPGPPGSAAPAERPAREAVFEVTGSPAAVIGGAQQVVIERARSPENSLIVPVSALWTATDGATTVIVVDADGARRVVMVEVLVTVGGQSAIRLIDGSIASGDRVVISYHGAGTGE